MTAHGPFELWREKVRVLLAAEVAPEHAQWDGDGRLLEAIRPCPVGSSSPPRVAARALDLLERVDCHRNPQRHALMYRLVWRLTHGEPRLLDDAADDDVVTLTRMAKAVDRACHKMTAFVRFRALEDEAGTRYLAWFEPEHAVLHRTAPFFVERFGTMAWSIATPDGGAHWDRTTLTFVPIDPALRQPAADAAEGHWLTYYQSIFNPARLNVRMMCKEMPQRYWKNLPEAARIPALVADAPARAGRMVESTLNRVNRPYPGKPCGASTAMASNLAEGVAPSKPILDTCRRCPLGSAATQAVAGEGPADARIMLVGEQPGDEEDLAGKPFVGPAGQVLRQALAAAGVDTRSVYMTNAVKHFGFMPRGKRRLHKTPAQREIEACRAWLDAEVAARKPRVIVALGATAAMALLRQRVQIGAARAQRLHYRDGAPVLVTYHPAAVLRAPDKQLRDTYMAALIADLRNAAGLAGDANAAS